MKEYTANAFGEEYEGVDAPCGTEILSEMISSLKLSLESNNGAFGDNKGADFRVAQVIQWRQVESFICELENAKAVLQQAYYGGCE